MRQMKTAPTGMESRLIARYPKTPYWPFSPSLQGDRGSRDCADPLSFVGCEIVVTEKLDGSNTLIHRGRTYGRGVAHPTQEKWMAMVKKHIAWRVQEPDVLLYGEDIYAIHSIEYGPVREDRTFYAFALRRGDVFAPFHEVEAYSADHDIAVVPVLHRGEFDSVSAARDFVASTQDVPSILGGDREGVVLRKADGFGVHEFGQSVCKSVRARHVRTSQDWRRTWRACPTIPAR